MDLVDEENRIFLGLDLRNHRLQTFFEVAAVARTGQQRAHVEGKDGGVVQHLRNVAVDDPLGQALGDRRLADTGIAHVERIVLGAPTQHLDGAVDFFGTADQRVDAAVAGLAVQVDAVGIEGLAALAHHLLGLGVLICALYRAAFLVTLGLGDAVTDVVHRVEPRHLLFLQVVDGMALALREHGDQHVGAGHLFAAGRLHVNGRALEHPLEACGRLGIAKLRSNQARELVVDVVEDIGPQAFKIHTAGPQHRHGIRIVDQRQEQMFERCVLVAPFVGACQGTVKRLL